MVVCSPLRRALHTTRLLLRGRPVPVIVVPELTEILSKVCDISLPLALKKEEFKDLYADFSRVEADPLFQLQLVKAKEKSRPKDEEALIQLLLDRMRDEYPEKLEGTSHCSKRSKLGLQTLKQLREQYDGLMCVVTHNRVFKNMAYCRTKNVPSKVAYARGYEFPL